MNKSKTNPSEGVSNQTSEINTQMEKVMKVRWDEYESSLFKKLNYTGKVEIYYENGTLRLRGNYIDGKKNGVVDQFYENGTLGLRSNYVDGKENGVLEEFYEDGTLKYRISYTDGKENGIVVQFNKNGTLEFRGNFIDGELVGSIFGSP